MKNYFTFKHLNNKENISPFEKNNIFIDIY